MLDRTRILEKLDDYLNRNDYDGAERHLRYWLAECESVRDHRTALLVQNELMGLYRKVGKREEAFRMAETALAVVEEHALSEQIGAATTFLNAATVYKAFGDAARALPLYEKARTVYERELPPGDRQFGGLYNNMALALVDLSRFEEANALYQQALAVMHEVENGALEAAITYLNMACAVEAEHGLLDGAEEIEALLDKAERILETWGNRDGYYAFVCEKCASVFGYHGRFVYEKELKARAKAIYERA